MALYESTFILRQDLSKQDVTKLIESYAEIVTKDGGKVVKNEYWGLRNLAYRINKTRKGHYNMLGLDASHAAIQEIERQAGLAEEVLRLLVIRVDEIDEGPSPVLKNNRDDSSDAEASQAA